MDDVATSFFRAVEDGDLTAVDALYHPDAVVWHNHDQVAQPRSQNLATLGWLVRHVENRRYEVVERIELADGFVQQHVLHGDAPGGRLELPAMMRVRVDGGLIVRIDEYFDTEQLRVLRAS
ncbi:MAG: nuclear transport factor 2 family protein [Actinobacteria bacterium]|nr:nuclear transport factor 2 family protein [Actinomycetota bacterium]